MGTTTLKPGESTTLSVSMMMHAGMEGRHRFRISLPVKAASSEVLAVEVKADFR